MYENYLISCKVRFLAILKSNTSIEHELIHSYCKNTFIFVTNANWF